MDHQSAFSVVQVWKRELACYRHLTLHFRFARCPSMIRDYGSKSSLQQSTRRIFLVS
jgi:hypothetical protein